MKKPWSRFWSLILLARAHFLVGRVVMYALGAVVAWAEGASPKLSILLWGQVGVSAIQLMTHFVNEYYDAGRDALVRTRTPFSGGSGVLPAGRMAKLVAIRGAVLCAIVGILVTLTVGLPVALVYH